MGDKDTSEFMEELGNRAEREFGKGFSELEICGDSKLRVDFYIPKEATIVEVALNLRNYASEFERDILKAILARESGHPVRTLLFIAKPGASKRCSLPGKRAIAEWAKRDYGIVVHIRELLVQRGRGTSRVVRS